MKKLIILILLTVLAGAAYYWGDSFTRFWTGNTHQETTLKGSGATPEAILEISEYQYTKDYSNSVYGFSFKYPEGFEVSSVPDQNNGEAILVQNISKNIGVQILINTVVGEDVDITTDIIRENIPDLSIDEPQELLVGTNRKGIAFVSDNEAFGGKSREAWFVYRGYLYQISTYAELDAFLKGLFGTWQFN